MKYDKSKCCCFTGHRKLPHDKKDDIKAILKCITVDLIEKGYDTFIAGGAHGFDMMAEVLILELKQEYPHIKLLLILPCEAQSAAWNEHLKTEYERIKVQADEFAYVSDKYTKSSLLKRNRQMVDMSSVCICYLTEITGGSFYTVNYANKNCVKVLNVADLI